ncbi:ATP-dependent nuclease [Niallia taxi]|uniref:ATP-dependent nuclease n=1 Tax=Niallia taxi TaxID=2499688 RepID=UPI003F633740
MRLKKFSVKNYKVFSERFTIDFSNENIVILTGRNNTGKSTFLEAINQFYLPTTAKGKIPTDCYSNQDETKIIELEAEFMINEETNETVTIIKKYANDNGKYYDSEGKEIKAKHELRQRLEDVLHNSPYYITPYMSTEEIDKQIQEIYSQIITSELLNLENLEAEEDGGDLKKEYDELKRSLPKLLGKLKSKTDLSLMEVNKNVTKNLQTVFSNNHLNLSVIGGESNGFTVSDIVKSTSTSILIGNQQNKDMPLSTQGTGIQRMSLIYIIQNLIEHGLLGLNNNKMLLIDEPEAFLHPEAVRALSRSLYSIGNRMPLIISTHSPILIDLSKNHTSIQVFRVGHTQAIELFQSSTSKFDANDVKNMKILNYVDSYVNEFFFADKIIIVEGDTEYIALKYFIREKNINLHVIRARGKATICTLMKVLNQFGTPYYILHDIDNHKNFERPTLKAQLTNCNKIYALKKTSTRIFGSISNFEQAIGIGDVKDSKKTETIQKIISGDTSLEFKNARVEIENLFEYIFDLSNGIELGRNFAEILAKDDYESFFAPMLINKRSVVVKRVKKSMIEKLKI